MGLTGGEEQSRTCPAAVPAAGGPVCPATLPDTPAGVGLRDTESSRHAEFVVPTSALKGTRRNSKLSESEDAKGDLLGDANLNVVNIPKMPDYWKKMGGSKKT